MSATGRRQAICGRKNDAWIPLIKQLQIVIKSLLRRVFLKRAVVKDYKITQLRKKMI